MHRHWRLLPRVPHQAQSHGSVLRAEAHGEGGAFRKRQGMRGQQLTQHHGRSQKPIHRQPIVRILDQTLRGSSPLMYPYTHADCPGGELFYYLRKVRKMTED